ncbi:hypothetical protein ANCDUO_06725 [Ancylostoma duodenale]|uniref:Uncharacterized protein n=1 Tax=Ancylostoma duodenale TaxID=51022 RepID=A0A0C2D0Y6_9BILA|nr:hypothetical protein ANCDUO_06725 [Ancylostoma duodenale]
MAVVFALLQIVGLPFVGQPVEELDVETEPLIMENTERSAATQLKSATFLLLFVSLTCNALWVQLISGLYKAYGQQFIHSDLFLSLVGSLASVFNACSRVIWGIVADSSVAGVAAAALSQFVLPLMGFDVLFLIMGSFMAVSLLLTSFIHCTVPKEVRVASENSYVEE